MAVVPCRELTFYREDFFSDNYQTRENVRSAINEHFYTSDLPNFSPEILEAMTEDAARNADSQEVIKEKLIKYIETKSGVIGYAIMEAKSEFLKHEGLKSLRSYEQRGLKEIDGLIGLAEDFYSRLPKIDFYQSPEPRSPQEYLYHWLGNGKNYEKEIERWRESLRTIEFVIKDLKAIKGYMPKRKRGPPERLDGLKIFVLEMAFMYQEVSGKTFKVDKLAPNKIHGMAPVTDGMRFVFSAVKAVNTEQVNYTSVNVYTACEDVRSFLGKVTPIISKKN